MCEVVLTNIPIEGGVVHPDVHWFFDDSGQAVFFSSNNFNVLHRCFMVTATLMYEYWGWGLQIFLKSFSKGSSWLSCVFFITVNLPTTVDVNYTVLVGNCIFIFWWHQDVLQCLTSLEMYSYSMFPTNILDAFTYVLWVWYYNVALFGRMFWCGGLFLLLTLLFSKNLLNGPLGIFALAQYLLQMLQFPFN